MSRVRRTNLPISRMPDRPGRWKLLVRRQRRLVKPTLLAMGALVVIGVFAIIVHAEIRGLPLRERVGSATADLGLRVQDIVIEGREKTPEILVRAALGVSRGEPILGFSVKDARARLEKLTWVQNATVERRLPDRIVVQIVERAPFAVWQNQGKFVLIDRAGELVADQDVAVFAKELPLVVGAGAPQAAADLVTALNTQPTLLARMIAAVRVGQRRWNLRMNNGGDVLLPEGQEVAALAKLAQLQTTYSLLDRPLQTIDLRAPDRLVLRPAPDKGSVPDKTMDKAMDTKADPAKPATRKPT